MISLEDVLPLGIKDPDVGKWSFPIKAPYQVSESIDGKLCCLIHIDEIEYIKGFGGKHLKPFKSPTSKWEMSKEKNVLLMLL